MSSENVHDAFALLLRHHQGMGSALGPVAVRKIRRRVATRWSGLLGAFVAAGILATAALDGGGGGRNTVAESPIPTPTIGFAAATFPLTGGPEFVPASSEFRCGDPAPASHPVEHDLRLTLRLGRTFALGDQLASAGPPVVQAVVREVTSTDKGAVATSGIDFLVIKDGVIKGMIAGSGVGLAQNVEGGTVSLPRSQMLVDGVLCQDGQQVSPAGLAPGIYDVIAVGRVFSTAESVALSQTLGDTINTMYLNPNSLADPAAVYLPGIYNCKQARAWRAALRGCLPEITSNAAVDETRGTVTVVYRVRDLVEEFSAVLVTDPLTVELVSSQEAAAMVTSELQVRGTQDLMEGPAATEYVATATA